MKRTPYQIGYYYERKAMNFLKKLGYGCISSRGSHGIVDIIAWKKKNLDFCSYELPLFLFIQNKSGTSKIKKKEIEKIRKFREELPSIAQLEIWFWKKYQKEPYRTKIEDADYKA